MPLSLVMISSSISFLAGTLSFSRIRNLQSLCNCSSLWTLVVQAGEEGGEGEENVFEWKRKEKERDWRVYLLVQTDSGHHEASWDQGHFSLPGWAWLPGGWVKVRSSGLLIYGAASLPGECRFFIKQVKFPLPSKSFFNCSGGSFVSFRSQALPCKEANPVHILLSIPSLFAWSELCVIFWNYPVYPVFVFVICLLHWPC